MKNRSASKSLLIGFFFVLVWATSNSIVRAQAPPSTNWIVSRGNWFTCSNWSGLCPNPLVDASINDGGQAQILSSDPNNPAFAYSLTLGGNQGDSGGVAVNGDTNLTAYLTVSADCYVGDQGNGTVSITNGGVVVVKGSTYIAALPNSRGTVTANGLGPNQHLPSRFLCIHPSSYPVPTGVFIGCTADSNGIGGTGQVNIAGGLISVENYFDTPSIVVGYSGTLTGGNGNVELHGSANYGSTTLSETVKVFGTLAPSKTLTIRGNLLLDGNATTVFNVKRLDSDSDSISVSKYLDMQLAGNAALDGLVLVRITDTDLTPGHTYTLLHAEAADGLHQTFFGRESITYPPNQCYFPEIQYDYNANNVNLYLKPTCD